MCFYVFLKGWNTMEYLLEIRGIDMEFFSDVQCSGHVKLKQRNTWQYYLRLFSTKTQLRQNFVHGGDSFTTWVNSMQRTRHRWGAPALFVVLQVDWKPQEMEKSSNQAQEAPVCASPISELTGNMNKQTTLLAKLLCCCQGTVQCHSEIEPGQDDQPKFLAELSTVKVWLWNATCCEMSSNICWKFDSVVNCGRQLKWNNYFLRILPRLIQGFLMVSPISCHGFPCHEPCTRIATDKSVTLPTLGATACGISASGSCETRASRRSTRADWHTVKKT